MMSNDGLSIENMEMSHIHLAVLSLNLEALYFLKLCPIFVDQTLHMSV